MNAITAIFADFQRSFLGTPSALGQSIAGATVLTHTLRRAARIVGATRLGVVVTPADQAAAAEALRTAGVTGEVLPLDDGIRPRAELLRAGRVWNLCAWRGGLLGATWFDEFVHPPLVARVLQQTEADAALCLTGAMPALDPAIASRQLQQQHERRAETSHLFSQAPPGVAGLVLTRQAVAELIEANIPVGIDFSYRPETPRGDPINRPPCLQLDATIVETPARWTGDTPRSRALLAAAFDELGIEADALALARWLRRGEHGWAGALPRELELELTTADPLPETTLRPRGARVPTRALSDLAPLARLADELAPAEDRLIVLGGHGDPLQHPEFAEVVSRLRSATLGLAVSTPLVTLTDAQADALFDIPVDLVCVQLDAHSPETYAAVHGRDAFAQVIANVERLQARRRDENRPRPLVICEFTRSAANLAELEPFYDHWIPRSGWAVLRGYDTFGGLLPDDPLMSTTPPLRAPCRRLAERLFLQADGNVPHCSQDVGGITSLGNWHTTPLSEIWSGPALNALRAAHATGEFADQPLCARCDQWFRP